MKALLFGVLPAVLLGVSDLSAARPTVLTQETSLDYDASYTDEEGNLQDRRLYLKLSIEYPVFIEGVSPATVDALRREIRETWGLKTGDPDTLDKPPFLSPMPLSQILKPYFGPEAPAEHVADNSPRALVKEVTFPFANRKYAMMCDVGDDYYGGCGTFGFNRSRLIRLPEMTDVTMKDLCADRLGLDRLIAKEFARTCDTDESEEEIFKGIREQWHINVGPKTEPHFQVKREGICFIYDVHTVRPGSEGMPRALIPWKKLRKVCRHPLIDELEALTK